MGKHRETHSYMSVYMIKLIFIYTKFCSLPNVCLSSSETFKKSDGDENEFRKNMRFDVSLVIVPLILMCIHMFPRADNNNFKQ